MLGISFFFSPLSGWNIEAAHNCQFAWRQVRTYGHSNLRWWPWTTQRQATSTSPRLHHTLNAEASALAWLLCNGDGLATAQPKKNIVLCYRMAGGAASHSDPKFVSREKLPPIPHTRGYVAGGGQNTVAATPH